MTTTTKKELVARVTAKNTTLTNIQIGTVMQLILDEIVTALANGERIELRDFGVFTPRQRKERTARNPKTGAVVTVPATNVAVFKLGKEFKLKLNPAKPAPKTATA